MPIDGPEAVLRAHVVGGNAYDRVAPDAWQAIRPGQPRFTDRRAGEHVDLLFAFRARKVSSSYINNTVIPMLCRKAGVPAADLRGNITSHRARSTIASLPRKRVLLTD